MSAAGAGSEPKASGLSNARIALQAVSRAGILKPIAPWTLVGIGRVVAKWGAGYSGGFQGMAVRRPNGPAIIDELGTVTYRELDQRSNALAHALIERGVKPGVGVAVMCRNHRGFVETLLAVSKVGGNVLLLNTAFAGPQLVGVLEREKPSILIHDEEFTGLLEGSQVERRILGWVDDAASDQETLESLIGSYPTSALNPPGVNSKLIILTSGTTGAPKGAPRKDAGLENAIALLSRLPLRYGARTHIAAPLFHTWGLAHLLIAALLGTTMVLRRSFDAEAALAVMKRERCDTFVAIPVMLQRILNLGEETLAQYRLPELRVTATSGSALPGDLAIAWMDQFGDCLYNTYGSTEVAYATIATPEDMRHDASTAGKACAFTTVEILDEHGQPAPIGQTGRIFVKNGMLFDGYTGGGNKEIIDGLMATGDVGRFDDQRRLYIEGRDDEMIISGGENVFPQEVENVIASHPDVVETAAIGVVDDEFGQRLVAFVVSGGRETDDEFAAELKALVRTELARYKVPREVIFLEELPRNATGKVLKRSLSTESADG